VNNTVSANCRGKTAHGNPRSEDESAETPRGTSPQNEIDTTDIIQHEADRDVERDAKELHDGGPALLKNLTGARLHKVCRNDKTENPTNFHT
jgi:hypothetical protein